MSIYDRDYMNDKNQSSFSADEWRHYLVDIIMSIFNAVARIIRLPWHCLKKLFQRRLVSRVVKTAAPKELTREPEHSCVAISSAQTRSTAIDAVTSQSVDKLLAKISRDGLNSLTDDERLFLNETSQKYKKQ